MLKYLKNKWKNRKVKLCEGYIKNSKNWYILYYCPEKNIIIKEVDNSFGEKRSKDFALSKSYLLMSGIAKKRNYEEVIRKYCLKFYQEQYPQIIK